RRGIHDLERQRIRQLNPDGSPLVVLSHDPHARLHPLRVVAEHLLVHLELIVVLDVHEVVRVATLVEELEIVRLHGRLLDGVRGAEAVLEARPRSEVLELRLHHRAQVTWSVMTELDDATGLALEDEDHTPTDLGGGHCHNDQSSGEGARDLLELRAGRSSPASGNTEQYTT